MVGRGWTTIWLAAATTPSPPVRRSDVAAHQTLIVARWAGTRPRSAGWRTRPGPRPKRVSVTIEHLDTCSHRLDAWLLGLPAAAGARCGPPAPTGVHLGAFGWVENLRPGRRRRRLATGVPPLLDTDQRSPIYQAAHDAGFIHAPSLNHAATAAILRAGYLAQPRAGRRRTGWR